MAVHGYEPPAPLPSNADAWAAFLRICQCRHDAMGTPTLPNWSDIRSVLELYGLWDVGVHSRLSICFSELMTLEAKARKAKDG